MPWHSHPHHPPIKPTLFHSLSTLSQHTLAWGHNAIVPTSLSFETVWMAHCQLVHWQKPTKLIVKKWAILGCFHEMEVIIGTMIVWISSYESFWCFSSFFGFIRVDEKPKWVLKKRETISSYLQNTGMHGNTPTQVNKDVSWFKTIKWFYSKCSLKGFQKKQNTFWVIEGFHLNITDDFNGQMPHCFSWWLPFTSSKD